MENMSCHRCQSKDAFNRVIVQGSHEVSLLCDPCLKIISSSSSPALSGAAASQHAAPPESLLEEIGVNLTADRNISPVIGRTAEINAVIEILNRKNKRNPVLMGESGVGKTAIVEGLAHRIATGDVPDTLLFKDLYAIDASFLSISPLLEAKVERLVHECKERGNVILFIDEVHLITSPGNTMPFPDAGSLLKKHLAQGGIQLIGATTFKDFKKSIERDAALARRFQPVIVQEPSEEEAFDILKGMAGTYESYHQVQFPDEVLQACVSLSKRYIPDRLLPDKAIDLLDQLGSKLNLTLPVPESKTKHLNRQMEKAVLKTDFQQALSLTRAKEALASKKASLPLTATVTHLKELIEQKTGVPVTNLEAAAKNRARNLESLLASQVIGQEKAVLVVSKAVKRNLVGLGDDRPLSFLFAGPTGVGKTELSKVLARELFGDAGAMIRLDMSEFGEKHAVSKLIGSPPGYIGHGESGFLTEKVKRQPYTLLLLDEIEKAHPDVLNLFLQVLDDGHLTDSQGSTISFKDVVIVATSNAGAHRQTSNMGFNQPENEKESFRQELTAYFKPELLNRFEAVISFNSLSVQDLMRIVDLHLHALSEKLERKGIILSIGKLVNQQIAELSYDPQFGARTVRRMIREHIEEPLSEVLLEKETKHLSVSVLDRQIVIS